MSTIKDLITLTDLKKYLYKNNPEAVFSYARGTSLYYKAGLKIGDPPAATQISVSFEVPILDMGDATFDATIDSKYLIRYIVYS